MKKTVINLVIISLLFACNNQSKEKKITKHETEQATIAKIEDSKIARKNYAIVMKWATTDKKLVEDNLIEISNEMNELWKNDDVENAYYNSNSKVDKFEYFPNICYFLKAKSIEAAKKILNNTLIVKKGIAKYTIYPVGNKWFGRNTDAISKKGMTNSYVSIWSIQKDIDQNKDSEIIEEQAAAITNLFNEGTIENVYWEFSGEPNTKKRRTNEIADFVFFVNVESEEEAKIINNNLPFIKNGLASYKLLPVGVFWLGEYENLK